MASGFTEEARLVLDLEKRGASDGCLWVRQCRWPSNFPPGLLPPFSIELPPFLSGPSRGSVMICRAARYIFYHIWFCKASRLHRNAKLLAVPKPSFTHSVDAQQGYSGGIQSTRQVPRAYPGGPAVGDDPWVEESTTKPKLCRLTTHGGRD